MVGGHAQWLAALGGTTLSPQHPGCRAACRRPRQQRATWLAVLSVEARLAWLVMAVGGSLTGSSSPAARQRHAVGGGRPRQEGEEDDAHRGVELRRRDRSATWRGGEARWRHARGGGSRARPRRGRERRRRRRRAHTGPSRGGAGPRRRLAVGGSVMRHKEPSSGAGRHEHTECGLFCLRHALRDHGVDHDGAVGPETRQVLTVSQNATLRGAPAQKTFETRVEPRIMHAGSVVASLRVRTRWMTRTRRPAATSRPYAARTRSAVRHAVSARSTRVRRPPLSTTSTGSIEQLRQGAKEATPLLATICTPSHRREMQVELDV